VSPETGTSRPEKTDSILVSPILHWRCRKSIGENHNHVTGLELRDAEISPGGIYMARLGWWGASKDFVGNDRLNQGFIDEQAAFWIAGFVILKNDASFL
jgi:hypothetical protein